MPDKPLYKIGEGRPATGLSGIEPFGGTPQGYTAGEFSFTPKYGADNYKIRAQNQSWGEQLGISLANLIPNIATGIVEGFGYLPELFDGDNDYSNAVTRTMQEWKNPFGEVYRENPNEVWDMGDSGWWFTHVPQLLESVVSFGVQGIGLAKIDARCTQSL